MASIASFMTSSTTSSVTSAVTSPPTSTSLRSPRRGMQEMPKQSGKQSGFITGPITFVHTSDWQLGKPFAGIADPAKRARVQQERFEAIRRIGVIVRERQAQFVVVAGDLFDSPTPARSTISAALGAIAELGVPVYAIPGNHDHAGPDSVWESAFYLRERERVAPNFHLLDSPTATVVDLGDRGAGPNSDISNSVMKSVVLLPCPLLRRHHADDPTAWIRSFDFSTVGEIPRIVIAHGSTAVFSGMFQIDEDGDGVRPANTIAIDRLPIEDLDYIALGDWHGFTAAGSKAWYAGAHETDRFPKAGQTPGHVTCVTVGRGASPQVDAVRTGRFRRLSHTIALDTVAEPQADSAAAAPDDAGAKAGVAIDGDPESRGPAYLDAWLTQATHPTAEGEPGFDGSLARITVTGTVSLAGRQELDRIIESWDARLLRLDLVDAVKIAPTADEIHELAERPSDPIISRVATELVQRLEAGGPQAEIDVIRQAIFMLHALAHPELSHRRDDSQRRMPKTARRSEPTATVPAHSTN